MEAETTGRNISCSEKYKGTPLSPKELEEYEQTWKLMENLEIIEDKPKGRK